jgi:hypothetical protein
VQPAERSAPRHGVGNGTQRDRACRDVSITHDHQIIGQRCERRKLTIEDRAAVHQQGALVATASVSPDRQSGSLRCA